MTKTIVVTGATGNQGGAVVRHLPGTDFTIKAVPRSLSSSARRNYATWGLKLYREILTNLKRLAQFLKGIRRVLSSKQLDQQC
ncbi:NmrA-like family protein [Pseudovibrio sp. Ad37]|nr:NmrA-like family protein [Pseudovibrio sp. Ad37]